MRFFENDYNSFVTLQERNGIEEATAKANADKAMQVGKYPLKKGMRGTPLTFIASRDMNSFGVVINHYSRPCSMEGCMGMRMHVRWGDGAVTFPCSKGVDVLAPNLYKIG